MYVCGGVQCKCHPRSGGGFYGTTYILFAVPLRKCDVGGANFNFPSFPLQLPGGAARPDEGDFLRRRHRERGRCQHGNYDVPGNCGLQSPPPWLCTTTHKRLVPCGRPVRAPPPPAAPAAPPTHTLSCIPPLLPQAGGVGFKMPHSALLRKLTPASHFSS